MSETSLTVGEHESFVYFILAPAYKRIKIGFCSGNPYGRLAELQTGCPERLVLIGFVRATRSLESNLHRKYRTDRTFGEWFRVGTLLIEYIRERCTVRSSVSLEDFCDGGTDAT